MKTSYSPEAIEAAFTRFANFSVLGEGGEGAVFSVWDRVRRRDLALKLIAGSDHAVGVRFEQEYYLLASARSNRLVTVYDHGQCVLRTGDGKAQNHYWYTMEKCETSVRQIFHTMPLPRRVTVCLQMLEGLAFLHAKSIAHRDIKPDNIFLVHGTEVKIGDFGLARVSAKAPHGALTRRDTLFMGSPAYTAPERWGVQEDTDWRPSDQYAAGMSIFEILSAGDMALAFGSSMATCLSAHKSGQVLPLRIPELCGRQVESVDHVIRRMLAKRPERRYPDIATCKLELSAALVQEDVWRERG